MKRKVIQLAGKTLLVSLPIKWAKKYGIKKGNEVEVEERGKSLLIATEKAVSMEKKEIVLSGPEEFIRRVISAEYKKGVSEITFKQFCKMGLTFSLYMINTKGIFPQVCSRSCL